MGFTLETNKTYWEDPTTISIIDKNLHILEQDFVLSHLSADNVIADVGCGNGEATIEYAKKVKHCTGIERSSHMRKLAQASQTKAGVTNLVFVEGDILDLSEHAQKYDAIVTQRVLINLPSWELQQQAIDQIHAALKPGGLWLALENTNDANEIMNNYRKQSGLKEIPTHWHNLFFDFAALQKYLEPKFVMVQRKGFNLYYFLTRVYSQMFAKFTGSGKEAVKDPIFEETDKAARVMQELFGDSIAFKDNDVFGPIQGFAYKKI